MLLQEKKVYTTAGPEFGNELIGKSVLIVRALYGLKSSGAAWRAHLANTLQQLGYKSCLADPHVWFRPAMKDNGYKYYEYVLVYADDLLVLSHKGDATMKALEEFYRLKDGFAPPTRYLGAEVNDGHSLKKIVNNIGRYHLHNILRRQSRTLKLI
jgi:hypothetical protein